MSEYVPPSDPEDNDQDYDEFELYRSNQPEQVFDFSDDNGENAEYTSLEVHNDPPQVASSAANLDDGVRSGGAGPDLNDRGGASEGAAPHLNGHLPPLLPISSESDNGSLDLPSSQSPPRDSQNSSHLSQSESESEDSGSENFDPLDNDDDFGIPLDRPPSRPMVNYPGDVEFEEDYEIGWQWTERDPGPDIAPYSGFRQCLLDPEKNKPEDFFDAIFDDHMFTLMAEMTNLYACRKFRGK